jgi:murein L,D-transpeptidase YafK
MRVFCKRQYLISAALAAVMALSGCTNTSDVLALRENAPLPEDVLTTMRAKGMTPSSPIMMRIFKEENVLEVWKQTHTGRYDLVKTYEICKYSGNPGPKFKEGDRQAPEGFYYVGRPQMNPRSSYHLSFNLGFPNAYDRSHGRTGSHLMVHGDCSSAGCYAMTDENIAEIYAFARDALRGGRQDKFLVKAYPFRMTPENMARHVDHEHFAYWQMLKEGYDHFELTKQPPKVDVCEKRYVFNQQSEGTFRAQAQCPDMSMPESLAVAYQRHQAKETLAFEEALAKLRKKDDPEIEPAPSVTPIDDPAGEIVVSDADGEAQADISPAPVTDAKTQVSEATNADTPEADTPAAGNPEAFPPAPAGAAPLILPIPDDRQ